MGCTSLQSLEIENPSSTQATVLDYAYHMAVNLVISIQSNNNSNFSEDFDPALKLSFTNQDLSNLSHMLDSNMGQLSNLEFEKISTEDGKIVVIYLCNFQKGSLSLILKLDPMPPYQIAEFSFPELK